MHAGKSTRRLCCLEGGPFHAAKELVAGQLNKSNVNLIDKSVENRPLVGQRGFPFKVVEKDASVSELKHHGELLRLTVEESKDI